MQEILSAQKVGVVEGNTPIFQRISQALDMRDAQAERLAGLPELLQDELDWRRLVVVCTSTVHPDDAARVLQRTRKRYLVWVAQAPGTPCWTPPCQPACLLPHDFRAAELCRMLTRLAHKLAVDAPPPRAAPGHPGSAYFKRLPHAGGNTALRARNIAHALGRLSGQDGHSLRQL
jgi:hypothetical protein